jgi:3-deoxy-D-manno-octulosonate 8-phosphate phosphatase KdsC-like HAD superfamily phosphatase
MNTNNIKTLVLDVDGVFTDGTFTYSAEGKIQKVFGPDDTDAMKIASKFFTIHIFSADHRGFDITKKRFDDVGFGNCLFNVQGGANRARYLIKHYGDLSSVAYVGDSFSDLPALSVVGYPFMMDCLKNDIKSSLHDIKENMSWFYNAPSLFPKTLIGGQRAVSKIINEILVHQYDTSLYDEIMNN